MAARTRSRLLAALFAGLAFVALWSCWLRAGSAAVEPARGPAPDPEGGPFAEATGAAHLPDFVEDELRQPVVPTPSAAPDDAEVTFESLLEKLVAITVAANAANQQARSGTAAQIEQLDREGREVLALLLRQVEAPDEKALFTLTGLPSEDTSVSGMARRHLCMGILRHGLDRKLRVFTNGGRRNALDHLVSSMLDSIPQDEVVAGNLAKLLTGKRYLGVAHEPQVLDLVALAAEERYLLPLVTDILETLWDNLQAEGARTSEELIHLALLFRTDANRAKRLVALRHLLVAGDGRYRELALHEVISTRDEEMIAELTMTVATKLEPHKAIETLDRLSLVTTRQLMPAFLTLGGREPRILVDTYEQKLADGTRPDYRAELVTGAGFRGGSAGLELARLAFANDPDAGVRARAMFVLAAQADAGEAEKALMSALDDSRFARDPARLGQIVLALEGIAGSGSGHANTVDRVGRRLRAMPGMRHADRQRLESILRRALPGGKSAGPGKQR